MIFKNFKIIKKINFLGSISFYQEDNHLSSLIQSISKYNEDEKNANIALA